MVECKVCGTPFKTKYRYKGQKQVYCSRQCRYADGYIEKVCPTCGKQFRTHQFSNRKDYCSKGCIERWPCQLCGKIIVGRATFQSGDRRFCSRRCSNIVHRTLQSKKKYGVLGFIATIKRIGKLACEHCGDDDPAILVVHHADSNHKNLAPENLITLCANCHHRVHWGDSLMRLKDVQVAHYIAKHVH